MTLLWAGNFIVGKIAVRDFTVFGLVGLRTSVSAAIFWVMFAFTAPAGEFARLREKWRLLLGVGLTVMAANQVFYVAGLQATSVTHAAVFGSMSPVGVFLISCALRQESVNRWKVVGLALAVLGAVALANLRPSVAGPGPTLKGDLFSLLSVSAFSIGTVLVRRIGGHCSAVGINAVGYTVCAVVTMPFATRFLLDGGMGKATPAGWASLAYMSLLSSVVAYLIFFWAIGRIGATRSSVFTYMQPVMVTLMGIAFLHDHISIAEVVCAAIILLGVILTERG
jgi:drug/metabolite transporter (DMT)-like permease